MAKQIKVKIENNATLPIYKTEGAAGMDLYANLNIPPQIKEGGINIKGGTSIIIKPLGRVLINTGLRVAIPKGYELQIRPRSGMALNQGLMLTNSPGTIDSDYRGDIGIIITNVSNKNIAISHGDRIAQAVLNKIETFSWKIVEELDETDRGEKGFGSTGTTDIIDDAAISTAIQEE